METLFGLPALAVIAFLGINGVKVTSGGQSRLVERLGKYDRQLQPGLSFVLPVVERVVSHESLKERVLDIPPQQCITRDNVAIEVDAVVYWQLLEHSRAYYAVDNLQAAMVNLVLTQIRAEMGKLDLDQTFTTRQEVNEALLRELDQATDPWGVKVTRVELRDIQPSRGVQQAMEQQMTAEREKRAAILRSEGVRDSELNAARGRELQHRPTRIIFDEGHHLFGAADSMFSARLSGQEAIEIRPEDHRDMARKQLDFAHAALSPPADRRAA